MHIEKYTKVPLDNSGENFLYIKNQCIGCFKGEEGSSLIFNKTTGARYDTIALYKQVVDQNGETLQEPFMGDNEDYFLEDNGEIISLVDFFEKFRNAKNEDEEKRK